MASPCSSFDRLLAETLAQAASPPIPEDHETEDDACPVFVVSEVVNASGGRSGCFLYRGRLATPAPRSRTPDCCLLRRSAADTGAAADRQVPHFGSDSDEEQPDLAEYEGQELTLYMSYEEASPKMKQRTLAATRPVAPWRVILRDQQDDMVFCVRGLPQKLSVDKSLQLTVWGSTIAVAFPTTEDTETFVEGLANVVVEPCSLDQCPQAALLEAHNAEMALAQAFAGKQEAATPASSSSPSASLAAQMQLHLPQHVVCTRATPVVGMKRRAETPAGLITPMVKPRFMTSDSLPPPPCFHELLD